MHMKLYLLYVKIVHRTLVGDDSDTGNVILKVTGLVR